MKHHSRNFLFIRTLFAPVQQDLSTARSCKHAACYQAQRARKAFGTGAGARAFMQVALVSIVSISLSLSLSLGAFPLGSFYSDDASSRTMLHDGGAQCTPNSNTQHTAFADVRNSDQTQAGSVSSLSIPVDQCPSITAEMAVVMDESGTVLFARDAYKANPIASITKVMTALVAVENAPLTTTITVTKEAARVGESSAHLKAGDTMPLSAALKALLIPSGNDAAVSIAESVGALILEKQGSASSEEGSAGTQDGTSSANAPAQANATTSANTAAHATSNAHAQSSKSTSAASHGASKPKHTPGYQAFIKEMNAYAARLGCKDTVYENPHGLDNGAFAGNLHSCAYDQGLIALEAMKHPELEEIFSMRGLNVVNATYVHDAKHSSGASGAAFSNDSKALPLTTIIHVKRNGIDTAVELTGHNHLLYNYHFARGIKTGTTDAAGFAFMGAARNDQGRLLVSVVIKSSSDQDRFRDTKKLFEWAYGHFVQYTFVSTPQTLSDEQAKPILNKLNAAPADAQHQNLPVLARIGIPSSEFSVDVTTTSFPVRQINMFGGNIAQRVALTRSIAHARIGDEVGKLQFYQNNALIEEVPLLVYNVNAKPHTEGFSLDGIFQAIEEFLGGLLQNKAESDVTIELYNTARLVHDARSRV